MLIKIIISILAIAAIIVHAVFPGFKIDIITLGLFVLALLPWLSSVIESFELPGGWKLKFQALEETAKRAERAGLISKDVTDSDQYSFQMIEETDPNLALAGLRIEIERRLKVLAEKNGIGTRMQGLGRLLQMLSDRGLIGNEEKSVLLDMTALLNSAVHGAKIDNRSYRWAIDFGPGIIKGLDQRINNDTKDTDVSKSVKKRYTKGEKKV